MSVPNWYELILLALASWRSWHLIALDDILDRPRAWATGIHKLSDRKGRKEKVADWLECPFCSGWWVALIWWILWLIFPTEVMYATVPFALSAGVIAAHKTLSSS